MAVTPALRSRVDRRRMNAVRIRNLECKRFVAGFWLLVMAAAAANHYRGWGIVGPYSEQFLVGAFAATGVWILRWGPTIRDIKAYNRLKRFREDAAWREELKRAGQDPNGNAS